MDFFKSQPKDESLINNILKENNKLLNKIDELNDINNKLILNKSTIHLENNKFKIIKTDIKSLVNDYKLINWSKNRPADIIRVNDITQYYKSNDITILPGIIYVWYNNQNYYIFDGIHRYQSAINAKINLKAIIKIYYTTNENDIISEFIHLNKSVSIPTLYLETDNLIKKSICESIAKQLSNKYPKFVSPSRKPYSYNFNRDMLIEFISSFEINFTLLNIDTHIFNLLLLLNTQAKNNVISNNINHPKKCKKYDFYLFYLTKDYIKTYIEQNINK